jgi:hypothetical protein
MPDISPLNSLVNSQYDRLILCKKYITYVINARIIFIVLKIRILELGQFLGVISRTSQNPKCLETHKADKNNE